jgi:hypothetical protein
MRQTTILFGLTLFAGVLACKPDEASKLKADGPASIYVMLGTEAAPQNANAFRLLAHVPGGVTDDSVVFCLASAAACANPEAATPKPVTVKGVATTQGTLKYYISERFVVLSNDLNVTVTAKDAAGKTVTQTTRIKTKGAAASAGTTATAGAVAGGAAGAAAASPCYKAPDEFTCRTEVEIVRLTNEKRTAAGKTALTYDQKISYVSRLWATEQNRVSKVSREWLDSGVWGQKYQAEFNAAATVTAETYGMAPTTATTIETVAKDLFDMLWANSAFQTIITGDHRLIGVGVIRGTSGWYVSQDFAP